MIKDLDFTDKSLLNLLNELRVKYGDFTKIHHFKKPKKYQTPSPMLWSTQESSLLYSLTCKYGQNWKLIATHFHNKKPKECRGHWFETFAKK